MYANVIAHVKFMKDGALLWPPGENIYKQSSMNLKCAKYVMYMNLKCA